MALPEPEVIELDPSEPDHPGTRATVARMTEMVEARVGWVNLQPSFAEEDAPPPRGDLTALFSGRGPDVPLATWTPSPVQLGVQHGIGGKAQPRLHERGITIPAEWWVRQDNPRRGLVLEPRGAVEHSDALSWLARAVEALSVVRLDGGWRVAVFDTR